MTRDLFQLSAGEAAHLAADFDYVCESEFPAAQLAERQYRQHADPSQQQSRKNAIIAAKYVPPGNRNHSFFFSRTVS